MGLERILQGNDDLLAVALHFGLLHLRRRDDNLFRRFVQLDKLVKLQHHLFLLCMECPGHRCTLDEEWRRLIVCSPFDTPYTGTRIEYATRQGHSQQSAQP